MHEKFVLAPKCVLLEVHSCLAVIAKEFSL